MYKCKCGKILKRQGSHTTRACQLEMRERGARRMNTNPNDGWAMVELWRWQYGKLPDENDTRPLDISQGLKGMADALEKNNPSNFPTPFNIISVLRYVAKLTPNSESFTERN